jgi:hypothetical protein
MSADDPLQQNIRRTTGQLALKKIRKIVDEENEKEATEARILRWMLRYGWIVLLAFAAVLARLIGVY